MVQTQSQSPANPRADGIDKAVGWIAPLIVVVLFAAYAGSWRVPPLLDDGLTFSNNPSIRSLSSLGDVLLPPPAVINAGRPVANLTFALNYAASGADPVSYHWVNVCIHVMSALVLFGVVRRTLLLPSMARIGREFAGRAAGAVALLWGLHPALTQSVTYVSQRTEELVALFTLLALYCFIRGLAGRKKLWPAGAAFCCLLGILSKEVGVTLPLVIVLFDRTFVAGSFRAALRSRWALYLALASTWVLTAWLMLDLGRRGVGSGLGVSPIDYALTQCKAVSIYLGLILWPHPLIFDRGAPLITSVAEVWPYALWLALVVAAVARVWWRSPVAGFAPVCFFILLAPASSVVPVVGATIAENRLYLPSAAVVTVSVLGIHRLVGLRRAQLICGVLAIVAAGATVIRIRAYQSEIGLWMDTVAKAPENPRAHCNLATLLAEQRGQQSAALAHFTAALQLQPDYPEAHYNLAVLLAQMPGKNTEAAAHFASAIQIRPDYAEAHHNLGLLLARTPGREAEATQCFLAAIKGYSALVSGRPLDAETHFKLANLLALFPERQSEARSHYAETLRLRPEHAEAHSNLAAMLARTPASKADSVFHYREALRIRPDLASAHNNLAVLLAADPGGWTEALAHYREALRLQPDYADASNNLANLLSDLPGGQEEAIARYKTAIRLAPENVAAHHNLALLLARLPNRRDEAMACFEEAVRLLPQNPSIHLNFAVFLESIPDQRSAAEAHYARALSLDPNLAAAQSALVRLRH